MEPIRRIVTALEPSVHKTSQSVREEMAQILVWLRSPYDRETDIPMVKNVESYTKGFWKGLLLAMTIHICLEQTMTMNVFSDKQRRVIAG